MEREDNRKKEEDRQRLYIDVLFSGYGDRDPADDLRYIHEYFDYLAQRIEYRRLLIEAPRELLTRFESVCLLLQDRLRMYPETIQHQVHQILKESKLESVLAMMGSLSDEDRRRLLQERGLLSRIVAAVSVLLGGAQSGSIADLPTSRSLFGAKTSLSRLAGIVRYASSIGLSDFDSGAEELKDHYDPALVDKDKILILISLLRVQAKAVRDADVLRRILEKLDRLDEEIRRKKPRWGRIIATCFILYGFLGDLKTVSPEIYNTLYRTAQEIVRVVHTEGSTATPTRR